MQQIASKKDEAEKYSKQLKTQFTPYWWKRLENHCQLPQSNTSVAKFVREAAIEKYNEIYKDEK